MSTVRFNVQMRTADIAPLLGLRLKCNAHEMPVHGRMYPTRSLLFRSHSVVSRQGDLAVVEMVLQELDDTFPEKKRAAFLVADLHLLLQDMTVPNVAVPFADQGQAEVLEEDVADEQQATPELLGMAVDTTATVEAPMEADFDDDTGGDSEDSDDGPERDGAGDHDQGNHTAAVGEAGGGYRHLGRDGGRPSVGR